MKIAAIVLAVVFFVVAALYGTGVLQFGAHESAGHAGGHVKHALVFAFLGVLSLVWLRFQTSSASASTR